MVGLLTQSTQTLHLTIRTVQTAKTFVGTAQYVAPELLENNETSRRFVYLVSHLIFLGVDRMSLPISSDLWALGCILYQMIAGKFAFHGLSEYLTWQKVKALDYTLPDGFDEQAKDLVQELLVKSPSERLGAGELGSPNDMKALKAHPFFASVNWATLWTVAAPIIESGLVKKEPKPANHSWDDVEYNWDHVVAFPRGHDEIPWAGEEDEEELDQRTEHGYNSSSSVALEEEIEEEGSSNTSEDTEEKTETDHPGDNPPAVPAVLPTSKPIPVPAPPVQQDLFATGSTTSSSEGSPIEKLGAALEAALRGRGRAQTPIQGNGVIIRNWSDFHRCFVLLYGLLIYVQVFDPGAWRGRTIPVVSVRHLSQTPPEQATLDNDQKENQNKDAHSHEQSVDLRQDREGWEGPDHQGRVGDSKGHDRDGEVE